MYRLIVSELADSDLDRIIAYMVSNLSASKAAAQFLDEVAECYKKLKKYPLMYEACRDPMLCQDGFRKALVKNYVLIYKVDEESKTVIIHRFFHGAEDYIHKI